MTDASDKKPNTEINVTSNSADNMVDLAIAICKTWQTHSHIVTAKGQILHDYRLPHALSSDQESELNEILNQAISAERPDLLHAVTIESDTENNHHVRLYFDPANPMQIINFCQYIPQIIERLAAIKSQPSTRSTMQRLNNFATTTADQERVTLQAVTTELYARLQYLPIEKLEVAAPDLAVTPQFAAHQLCIAVPLDHLPMDPTILNKAFWLLHEALTYTLGNTTGITQQAYIHSALPGHAESYKMLFFFDNPNTNYAQAVQTSSLFKQASHRVADYIRTRCHSGDMEGSISLH